MAVATVVAVGSVADPLVEAIGARLPKIKVGPGSDPAAEMGPLVTKVHRDKVASYLDSATAQGATLVADGREHPLYTESEGFFLGTSADRRRDARDGLLPRRDLRAGADRDPRRAPTTRRSSSSTRTRTATAPRSSPATAARPASTSSMSTSGMVGINVPIPVPVAYYSFGGWKASLFGDLHMYGPEGIQFYTRAKVVTSRWPDPGTSKVDLGFPRTR